MQVVPPREAEDYSAISYLLDEIAEVRDRLQRAVENGRIERERLQSSQRRLRDSQLRLVNTWSSFQEHMPTNDGVADFRKLPRQETTSKLTAREIQVVRLIAEGLSTKEIAARLQISFKTAVTHRSHILAKLKCHESASVVRWAVRAGLVD